MNTAAAPSVANPSPTTTPAWPPRPAELAHWPIPRRQAWGERANELIDTGLPWREAEAQAFAEVKAMLPQPETTPCT